MLVERTTARKSSRFGMTYTTTWNGAFSASFTFWPAMGGYLTISRYAGGVFRGFERTYEACITECASVCDPEHRGRYIHDNEPHMRLQSALERLAA